eukprot:TRINITY_DN2328_c0_g1_i2.p1 TRINITY_DN2328_c0_g1~~TRINITY_DN2328_c0_g1_i2.p1  ORF type:complete len:138 (+),score=3.02 TRINITY_DN2328_c0_g1_i2:44-415(+)
MQVSVSPFIRGGSFRKLRMGNISMRSYVSVSAQLKEQITQKNKENPVMVYSKSYCPFCGQVKGLFNKLQIEFKAVELDQIQDGAEVQDALAEVSGMSTVPQVFVNEKLVGGLMTSWLLIDLDS